MDGRPGCPALDFHRQYSLNPSRCHLTTVAGCTIASAERQFGQSLESQCVYVVCGFYTSTTRSFAYRI